MHVGAPDANLLRDDQIAEVDAGIFSYRRPGNFTRAGKPIVAPLVQAHLDRPFEIMKYQVAAADYQRCVRDGSCRALDDVVSVSANLPAVGISWRDADDYAGWLTRKTGDTYRLPTDEEWVIAAADRSFYRDPSEQSDQGVMSPAIRTNLPVASKPRVLGSFGVNQLGLFDIAGNVWEWTSTCLVHAALDVIGSAISESTDCGIRVVEGRHRAYVTDIVRDARTAGCAELPPSNLGFHLVRVRQTGSEFIQGFHRLMLDAIEFVSASSASPALLYRACLLRQQMHATPSALPAKNGKSASQHQCNPSLLVRLRLLGSGPDRT
jgi:formylglycine-generating enzyme required for sulfatase activity